MYRAKDNTQCMSIQYMTFGHKSLQEG